MGKPFVEDARLDGVRGLGHEHALFEAAQRANRGRADPESKNQGAQAAGEGDEADGHEQTAQADARSVQGDDFAIGGEAAEADEDADQDGHGNGEGENGRQGAEKNQGNGENAAGVTDDEVHEADELRDEEDEGENGQAQQGVGGYFAAYILIYKTHVVNAKF